MPNSCTVHPGRCRTVPGSSAFCAPVLPPSLVGQPRFSSTSLANACSASPKAKDAFLLVPGDRVDLYDHDRLTYRFVDPVACRPSMLTSGMPGTSVDGTTGTSGEGHHKPPRKTPPSSSPGLAI